ncbi:MAG TPA: VPLPA-CTERM sorting domain-containing protein [Spongiibacteraceae bacterium]|nr:VPLPA-CTERM sorting domain-containing protein [Spongiibacteraceae bacterium]
MKKITLVAAVSAAIASPAFAASYSTLATSGTLDRSYDSMSSVDVQAFTSVTRYYVSNSAGTASNKSNTDLQGAMQLMRQSDWTFDFTDLNHVAFTGNIQLGDYKVQTNVTGALTVDGRQTFAGATQSFSGVGTYDVATNTFTYVKPLGIVNAGDASVYTQTSSACSNGATSSAGKVCSILVQATQAWEGLALNFVFTEPGGQFTGSVTGIDTSGSGLTAINMKYNWLITTPSGPLFASEVPISSVPIPAPAWLFGSGLVGLIGAARRRKTAR